MADWSRHFDEPIPVPGGRELVTLEDAGTYITKLSRAEHEAPEWRTAIELLIMVAEPGGDPMMPRIAMMRAPAQAGAGDGGEATAQAGQELPDRAVRASARGTRSQRRCPKFAK